MEKDAFGAGDSMDIERDCVVSSDLRLTEPTENTDEGELVLMLQEDDIPGASLNGKDPSELNVVQLKRWLACRGAPLSGKKPELIDRYNLYYNFSHIASYCQVQTVLSRPTIASMILCTIVYIIVYFYMKRC